MNTDDDEDEYREKLTEYGVTWRSAWQGSTRGPIPTEWGIDSYPTIFVLDAKHVLRYVNTRGVALERAVETLLAEAKAGQEAR